MSDETIYSVLAGKPGTCCIKCETFDYANAPNNCPAGFTSEPHLGSYRCARRIYTSIGCIDDPGAIYSGCYASGGTPSFQSSPCP